MRSTVAVLVITAAAAAVAAGVAGVAGVAGAQEQKTEEASAAWQLRGVSPDGRSLELVYEAGGCSAGDGRVVVEETFETVRVDVRHTVPGRSAGVACPADSRPTPLTARLSKPVHGRRVEGQNTDHLLSDTGGRVPRVVGLSPGDAADLLGRRGYHVRTRGSNTTGQVGGQRPRAGSRLRGRRTVALSITFARR